MLNSSLKDFNEVFNVKRTNTKKQYHFWEEVMKDYEGSGLSAKEFCNKNNLDFIKFKNWRYKIQQKQRNARPGFIPVVINNQTSTAKPIIEEHPFELRVTGDGVHIRIPSQFNREALGNILTVIKEIKC